jgi:hypothetical protein
VDAVAEKQTKIVSRQKCIVSETTHDTKTGNTLSRQKKVGNACRGRKLSEAKVLFVIFFLNETETWAELKWAKLAPDHRGCLGSGDPVQR